MLTENLEINDLSEQPQFADVVSGWIFNEFIKDVRDDLPFEKLAAHIRDCGKETLPIRLIAVLDGKCVGTVSIVENDLKCRAYTPWLAALVVDKELRGAGIGKALIAYAQKLARQMGYKELFLRTEHASGYYKKLGWQFVEKCADQYNLVPEVFKCVL